MAGAGRPPRPRPTGCCAPGSPSSEDCGSEGGGSGWRRAVRSGAGTHRWAAGRWDGADPRRAGRGPEPDLRVPSWALAAARLV